MRNARGFLLTVLCAAVLAAACNGARQSSVADIVAAMMGQTVTLPLDRMERVESVVDSGNTHPLDKDYTIVVYVDSSDCSGCQVARLYEWNALMKELDGVAFVFIVAPDSHQRADARLTVPSCGLLNKVYVDTAFVFRKENAFLPDEARFHTFLLDQNRQILIVGDPLHNIRIHELMEEVIRAQEKKSE